MSLADLIKKRSAGFATAIPAIPATDGWDGGVTVARIATIAVAKARSEETEADALAPMTDQERAAVLCWLAHIGESSQTTIAEVLARCEQDIVARSYFVGRAAEVPTLPTCEAYEERAAAFDVGCATCAHRARPGLSDGYCGAPGRRDDLAPAYGPGHPLRKLPGDQGASCKEWRAHQ